MNILEMYVYKYVYVVTIESDSVIDSKMAACRYVIGHRKCKRRKDWGNWCGQGDKIWWLCYMKFFEFYVYYILLDIGNVSKVWWYVIVVFLYKVRMYLLYNAINLINCNWWYKFGCTFGRDGKCTTGLRRKMFARNRMNRYLQIWWNFC